MAGELEETMESTVGKGRVDRRLKNWILDVLEQNGKDTLKVDALLWKYKGQESTLVHKYIKEFGLEASELPPHIKRLMEKRRVRRRKNRKTNLETPTSNLKATPQKRRVTASAPTPSGVTAGDLELKLKQVLEPYFQQIVSKFNRVEKTLESNHTNLTDLSYYEGKIIELETKLEHLNLQLNGKDEEYHNIIQEKDNKIQDFEEQISILKDESKDQKIETAKKTKILEKRIKQIERLKMQPLDGRWYQMGSELDGDCENGLLDEGEAGRLILGSCNVQLEIDGQLYGGKLDFTDKTIHWNDGDVWTQNQELYNNDLNKQNESKKQARKQWQLDHKGHGTPPKWYDEIDVKSKTEIQSVLKEYKKVDDEIFNRLTEEVFNMEVNQAEEIMSWWYGTTYKYETTITAGNIESTPTFQQIHNLEIGIDSSTVIVDSSTVMTDSSTGGGRSDEKSFGALGDNAFDNMFASTPRSMDGSRIDLQNLDMTSMNHSQIVENDEDTLDFDSDNCPFAQFDSEEESYETDEDEEYNCSDLISEAFKVIDKNGDGVFDHQEFYMLTEMLGLKLTQEQAYEMFAECDVDDDGVLDEEECADFLLTKLAAGDDDEEEESE